jgi:antitoxin ParD1/3/4
MSKVQKISIALTPELNAMVQEAVASGQYATTSEVVREALRDWTEKKTIRTFTPEELRFLWNEGKASGKPKPLDMENIITRAKERLERSRANSP